MNQDRTIAYKNGDMKSAKVTAEVFDFLLEDAEVLLLEYRPKGDATPIKDIVKVFGTVGGTFTVYHGSKEIFHGRSKQLAISEYNRACGWE